MIFPFSNGKFCFLISVCLFVQSFGIYGCGVIFLCLFSFLIGILLRQFYYLYEYRFSMFLEDLRGIYAISEGEHVIDQMKDMPSESNVKLQCSENLERLINEVLDLTLRDFVQSWYSLLTNDDSFAKCLRVLVLRSLRSLIIQLRRVNWVPLLTHDVVDDFATHLRLFRKAKQRCIKNSYSTQEEKAELLEKYFFEMENELEKTLFTPFGRSLEFFVDPSERLFTICFSDVVASRILAPLVDLLSDPDFICQSVLNYLSDVPLKYEDFITILENSEDPDELTVTNEVLQQEIETQRSKDTGGADDNAVKQCLNSLLFLKKLVINRLSRLQTNDSQMDDNGEGWQECAAMYDLSLAFVLCNHVALRYFVDYLSHTDGKSYIDLYLTIEGFKNSFSSTQTDCLDSSFAGDVKQIDSTVLASAREVALEIYKQYLENNCEKMVDIDENIKKRLLTAVKTKAQPSQYFDELQRRLYEILEKDPRFYLSFKRSYSYVKLLAELKLLPILDKDESEQSDDVTAEPEYNSAPVLVDSTTGDECDDFEDTEMEILTNVTYETDITTIGIGNDQSNMFAVYNIQVRKLNYKKECIAQWVVTRRYSDFYTFNGLIKRKFPYLGKISFPAKRAFNNMQHDFLERRKRSLNSYLRTLLDPALLRRCVGLEKLLLEFLCQKEYPTEGGTFSSKITSVVDPIRSGVKYVGNAVISMPDTLFDGVCRVGDGLGKVTRTVLGIPEAQIENDACGGRVADSLSYESVDSIPLRILMLLMEEIFGQRNQNQWIRRRMVTFLQQFIHATQGYSFSRKIVEYVHWLTSETQLIYYIKLFRNAMWPNGQLVESYPPRSAGIQLRTRIAAKAKVLAMLPDELKLFIGNETSCNGICLVFEAFQYKNLNRRLCYVLTELVKLISVNYVLKFAMFNDEEYEKTVIKLLKQELETQCLEPLDRWYTGCISRGRAYKTDNGTIFVKFNQESDGAFDQLKGEYASLRWLYAANCIQVPKPIKCIEVPSNGALLVAEYIPQMKSLSKYAFDFGVQMAKLHLHNAELMKDEEERAKWVTAKHDEFEIQVVERFGFHIDTACGSLIMENTWNDNWVEFFLRQRLQKQYDMAMEKHNNHNLFYLWPYLINMAPRMFVNLPQIKPSLLHGDLWPGNVGETSNGAVAFDPASFYGHNEFDFGIATMFGQLPPKFFQGYRTIIPKERGEEERLLLYQLFHYLNHWNHFGGSNYCDMVISHVRAITGKII
ncbi:Sorting nexin-13 [Trichinella sp. T9]|nr:Sorting nexin-13 [Trichinella sp. T9]